MSNFWKWAGIALLIGVVALLLIPVFGETSVVGAQTKNLVYAKQLANAAKVYAEDNEGRFPLHLSELEPDYLPPGLLEELLCGVKVGKEQPPRLRFDWLYFGAFFDEKNPPPLLIASPQAFTVGKKWKRIIIRGDGSGSLVNDDEYQRELRKTIEAMHKRAGTPTTPATEAPPASPDAAAAPTDQKTPEATDEKPGVR